MLHTNVEVFKPVGVNSSATPVKRFLNKLLRVQPHYDPRALTGVAIDIDAEFLTLEHKDGRVTMVRIADIATISELGRSSL